MTTICGLKRIGRKAVFRRTDLEATVRALLEHVVRPDVELSGASPRAVQRWLNACRFGGTI